MMKNRFFSRARDIPRQGSEKNRKTILLLLAVSLVFFSLSWFLPLGKGGSLQNDMLKASKIMEEAVKALGECRKERGSDLDPESDPNRTGLIGFEYSPLTTSLGNLGAKRTTTNPSFAALVVYLLQEAGVKRGDTVAVGASSSFPALIVAVLSATEAMELKPLMICSLGASQWGANDPEFTWLDMLECLSGAGIFNLQPIALSLGGEKDIGEDMSSEGRSFLSGEIGRSGIPFIHEPALEANVGARMELYEREAGQSRIEAFINIGGSWANMGTDSEILKVKPGLARISHFPPVQRQGVIFEMASRSIPVIHLLFIRGLTDRYGLSWDPSPLPSPGKEKIYRLARQKQAFFLIIAAVYLLLVVFALAFRNKLG